MGGIAHRALRAPRAPNRRRGLPGTAPPSVRSRRPCHEWLGRIDMAPALLTDQAAGSRLGVVLDSSGRRAPSRLPAITWAIVHHRVALEDPAINARRLPASHGEPKPLAIDAGGRLHLDADDEAAARSQLRPPESRLQRERAVPIRDGPVALRAVRASAAAAVHHDRMARRNIAGGEPPEPRVPLPGIRDGPMGDELLAREEGPRLAADPRVAGVRLGSIPATPTVDVIPVAVVPREEQVLPVTADERVRISVSPG